MTEEVLPEPETLEQAVAQLVAQVPVADKIKVEGITESEFTARAHHGFGTGLRNNWNLWKEDSPLHQHFRALGLWHADDMSGIILTCFYRELKGIPWEVGNQITYYQEYWAALGLDENGNKIDEDQ